MALLVGDRCPRDPGVASARACIQRGGQKRTAVPASYGRVTGRFQLACVEESLERLDVDVDRWEPPQGSATDLRSCSATQFPVAALYHAVGSVSIPGSVGYRHAGGGSIGADQHCVVSFRWRVTERAPLARRGCPSRGHHRRSSPPASPAGRREGTGAPIALPA